MTDTTRPASREGDPRFVIIGAGMAGVLAAIKLREAGFDDFAIYEKADRLGGTWRENTYPGIACDVPSHLYSYSFAPNPDWSHRFSPGPEIQRYFERVAGQHGIDRLIRFGCEVTGCRFADGRWQIAIDDGTEAGARDVADFVIAATGVLHHPAMPDFPGLESFAGPAFHSARWDHGVDLEGKRIGLVGTGSSAVQILPALIDRVGVLTLFQRTPQWITPVENPAYGDDERERFRRDPASMAEVREQASRAFIDGFANVLVDAESPALQMIHQVCEANLENSVADPELREKLRPDYRATCKRLVLSPDFYQAIQKPNARLVTEVIGSIEPEGVRTGDGELHPLDVLVLATGFRVDSFVRPMQVVGRGGKDLDEVWKHGPTAYLAVSVPDFPNFFFLNGPNGPVGNFSLIDVAERQVDYILQLAQDVRDGAFRQACVSSEAMARFDAERIRAARNTIWATGCRSWYLDEQGVPTAWPFRFDRFIEEMSAPRLEDFDLR